MLSVGRRNLLQRIARSRMASDVHNAWRTLGAMVTLAAMMIGMWVMISWLIALVFGV